MALDLPKTIVIASKAKQSTRGSRYRLEIAAACGLAMTVVIPMASLTLLYAMRISQ